MVYVTFVNTTNEDIDVTLSGTGASTVSIVNEVTGTFDRQQTTNTITVPAKNGTSYGQVKIVLPGAVAGTDSFTASVTNLHLRKKMWVTGQFDGSGYGTATPAGDHDYQSQEVHYNNPLTYSGVLQTNATGIVVT